MAKEHPPPPHPTFRKWLGEQLGYYDKLPAEDRDIALSFFRIWFTIEETKERNWEIEEKDVEPRILGSKREAS